MQKKIRAIFPGVNIKFHGHIKIYQTLSNIYKNGSTPIVISHHNQNESNYMQYEMIHYNIPMIHTSKSIKCYGLYYTNQSLYNLNHQFNEWMHNNFSSCKIVIHKLLTQLSYKNQENINTYTQHFFNEQIHFNRRHLIPPHGPCLFEHDPVKKPVRSLG